MSLEGQELGVMVDLEEIAWALGRLDDMVIVEFILYVVDNGLESWDSVRRLRDDLNSELQRNGEEV